MRRASLLIALIVGLVAASAVAIVLRPTVLGLDLQGGVEVTLQGKPTEEARVTEEAIARSVEIIRSRVDAFGVAEPEIQTQGDDQINVALPGADNPQQVVDDLIKPAQLQFIDFEANVVNPEGTTSLLEAIRLAQ
ncbi:MAG: protein translocase subunit SecD, partial [Thermoleophilia bacterium]|nr:protein translocase subunit SecD [Thermoleophilia bacterium]